MFKAYRRYFDFQGRSSRSEYWLFFLFYLIVIMACGAVFAAGSDLSGEMSSIAVVAMIAYCLFVTASIIPSLAVSVRRLHDTDRSGWLVLLGIIPLIGLVLIYFFVLPGTKGSNKYGADPFGQSDAEVFA